MPLSLGPDGGTETIIRTLDPAWTRLRAWITEFQSRIRGIEIDLATRTVNYTAQVSGTVAVGDLAVPRLIDRTGVLVECSARVGTPPEGADLLIEWRLNGAMVALVTIPDGLDRGVTVLEPPVPVTKDDDVIQASVTQVGSVTPGSDLWTVARVR